MPSKCCRACQSRRWPRAGPLQSWQSARWVFRLPFTAKARISTGPAFDIIPRIITAKEWQKVSRGLAQRSRALNCFIDDVYNRQKILADGLLPRRYRSRFRNYKAQCAGVSPRYGAWHIFVAPTWCVIGMADFTCWKTICGCHRACLTCWKTGKLPSGYCRNYSRTTAYCRWMTTLPPVQHPGVAVTPRAEATLHRGTHARYFQLSLFRTRLSRSGMAPSWWRAPIYLWLRTNAFICEP